MWILMRDLFASSLPSCLPLSVPFPIFFLSLSQPLRPVCWIVPTPGSRPSPCRAQGLMGFTTNSIQSKITLLFYKCTVVQVQNYSVLVKPAFWVCFCLYDTVRAISHKTIHLDVWFLMHAYTFLELYSLYICNHPKTLEWRQEQYSSSYI